MFHQGFFKYAPLDQRVRKELRQADIDDIALLHIHSMDVALSHETQVMLKRITKMGHEWYFCDVTVVRMTILRVAMEEHARMVKPVPHGLGVHQNTVGLLEKFSSGRPHFILICLFILSSKIRPFLGISGVLTDKDIEVSPDPTNR